MKKIYKKYEELINYIIVGVFTMLVTLVSYYFLRFIIFTSDSQLHIQISNIISFILAVLFSYYFNQSWVFKSDKKGKEKLKEFISFCLSRIITLIIDLGSMFIFTAFMHISDKIAKLLVQVIITIANYLIGKYLVFKNK